MQVLTRYIAFFFLLLLFVPLLQKNFRVFKEQELHGAVLTSSKPSLSWKNWSNGLYQDEYAHYLDHRTGFRALLIKIRNQLNKSLFEESGEKDFFIGQRENVFSWNNIRSVTGKDFMGREFYVERIKKIKLVQDSLEGRGIPFFFVLAPGKANLFPQDLPIKFKAAHKSRSNYYWLSRSLAEQGVHYTDVHDWFKHKKDSSAHVLLTKLGIHWSVYAQTLVLDSLLKLMEKAKDRPLRGFIYERLDKNELPRYGDNDTEPILNLMQKPKYETYTYPVLRFTGDTATKPRVLCVGDSYFLSFIQSQLADSLFSYRYWYYHNTAYANGRYAYGDVKNEKDYWNCIWKADYIMLLHSEVTWNEPGFNFIDRLYAHFTAVPQ